MKIEVVIGQNKNDGYASVRDDLIKEFIKRGHDIDINLRAADISLVLGSPKHIINAHSRKIVLYSMFESTKLPANFRDAKRATRIVVPTNWCREVFSKNLNIPEHKIDLIPLGVNTDDFRFVHREPNKVFTVLHYNAFNLRKGTWYLFDAWNKAFKYKKDTQLILKTTYKQYIPLHQYKNIHIVSAEYSRLEMLQLLRIADLFVLPSMGEGFGYPLLEAAATGIRAVGTSGSGMADFVNLVGSGIKVKAKSKAMYGVPEYDTQDLGYFDVPDVDDLAKILRMYYNYWKNDGDISSFKLAEYVRNNWGIDKTVGGLLRLFNEIL